MRNIDEHTITEAVLQSLSGTPDARLKQIMASLVMHLHDFVRDVRLTEDEWQAAIAFLTATGQTCTDTRQEFILLSDTLGVSMLTIALNHAKPAGATEATVFGPFLRCGVRRALFAGRRLRGARTGNGAGRQRRRDPLLHAGSDVRARPGSGLERRRFAGCASTERRSRRTRS